MVAALSRGACVQRSADPRWGRRDATTGGAFLAPAGPPLRSARSRRPQESGIFARRRNNSCVARGGALYACARRPRAAPQHYEAMELRPARAR